MGHEGGEGMFLQKVAGFVAIGEDVLNLVKEYRKSSWLRLER